MKQLYSSSVYIHKISLFKVKGEYEFILKHVQKIHLEEQLHTNNDEDNIITGRHILGDIPTRNRNISALKGTYIRIEKTYTTENKSQRYSLIDNSNGR